MNIKIITDGNKRLGLGHIFQSTTLASYIVDEKKGTINIEFLTKSDKKVRSIIESFGFNSKYFLSDKDILNYLIIEKPHVIIIDKLDLLTSLVRSIKTLLKSKLVIINTLTKARKYADISVHTDFESKSVYNSKKIQRELNRIIFIGPKYWIIRKDFFNNKIFTKNKIDRFKILVLFGGSDPNNLSLEVIKQLQLIDDDFEVNVILGPLYKYEIQFDKYVDNLSCSNITVYKHKNVLNVANIMKTCNLVFVSPGLSFVEALVLKKPIVGFHQNSVQAKAYCGLFKTIGIDEIHTLPDIIHKQDFIYPDNQIVKNMEIGEGINELVQAILN